MKRMAKDTQKRDVIIIGAGMAGLTAALYTGRMNLSTLVLENALVGGQIANATGIENYPGYEVIKGGELIATRPQSHLFRFLKTLSLESNPQPMKPP